MSLEFCYLNLPEAHVNTESTAHRETDCQSELTIKRVSYIAGKTISDRQSVGASPPPPPHSIEPCRGYHVCSPSPEPPISGIGYHWQLQKTPPFPGFLAKSSRDYYGQKIPPFSEKMGMRMRPRYAFEWEARGCIASNSR